jgi:hypothetical protein
MISMAKVPIKHGKPWSQSDIDLLVKLASQNTPTRLIALKLQRTIDAVYNKAQEIGLSLKPTNQSPYNRRNG